MAKNNRFKKYNATILPGTKVKFTRWPLKERYKKILLLVIAAVVIYFYFCGNTGIIHLVQSKYRQNKLEKAIVLMEEENRRAIAEIQSLKTDLKTVERLAREELGLIKKGEVVYKFVIKKEGKSDTTGDRNNNQR